MLFRLYHTLKYLKLIQFYYLLKNRVFKKSRKRPIFDLLVYQIEPWNYQTYGLSTIDLDCQTSILNINRHLRLPEDWNTKDETLLWQFHLHYLEDLSTEFAQLNQKFFKDLILSWLQNNTDYSQVGWHPYPTSKRTINMLKFALNGAVLPQIILNLISEQAKFVACHLEKDIQANHFFTNLVALAFWENCSSNKISHLDVAREIQQQLQEQILSDGMHYERSPMYHNQFTYEVLDLINLLSTRKNLAHRYKVLLHDLREKCPLLLKASKILSLCNNKISCFNDTAVGSAIQENFLTKYARVLGLNIQHPILPKISKLCASGFIRADNDEFTLIMNAGNVTSNNQPGHTHAESLSFELCDHSNIIFQNPGISTYADSARRSFERSTQFHNTVVIDQENSSDTWGSFRLGNRACTRILTCEHDSNHIRIAASHDGYKTRRKPIYHKREIILGTSKLVVSDEIFGPWQLAHSFFYLSPQTNVARIGDELHITTSDTTYKLEVEDSLCEIKRCLINLDFNKSVEGHVIKTTFTTSKQRLSLERVNNATAIFC